MRRGRSGRRYTHSEKAGITVARNRIAGLLVLLAIIVGCTPVLLHEFDQRFGTADPQRYVHPKSPVRKASAS